jgi:spermidine synthase
MQSAAETEGDLEQPDQAAGGHVTLYVVVFSAGAATMGIEMAGSRLLAPFFGTSLYVWAVLIGLIMIYLAVGYTAGGRLADAFPRPDVLYRLTAVAGFAVGLIPLLSRPILQWSTLAFSQLSAGIFLGSLIGVLLLFAIPVSMLGFVSPFAVRLTVGSVRRAGNASGHIYALSTTGSLVGTFATVFLLIPTIGTRRTLLALSLLLVAVSLVGIWRRAPLYFLLLIPALVQIILPPGEVRAAESGRLIYEGESAYYYIQVVQNGSRRELVLDDGHAVHSVYDPHRLLTGEYWDYFLAAPLFSPRYTPGRIRSGALLGLGGGTSARLFAAAYPGVHLSAAEIDPQVVSVARRYFGLHEQHLRVYTEDARYFLLTHPHRYDVVLVDAFRQPYIPFQLTTRDFFTLVRRRLHSGGVVAVNAGHTQTDFRLVNALARTMRTVFPSVYIVDVPGTINSIVVGSSRPATTADFRRNVSRARGISRIVGRRALLHGNIRPAPPSGPIFTDDLAPVEQMVDQIVLDYIRSGT